MIQKVFVFTGYVGNRDINKNGEYCHQLEEHISQWVKEINKNEYRVVSFSLLDCPDPYHKNVVFVCEPISS